MFDGPSHCIWRSILTESDAGGLQNMSMVHIAAKKKPEDTSNCFGMTKNIGDKNCEDGRKVHYWLLSCSPCVYFQTFSPKIAFK